MITRKWRRSSYSGSQGNCVEARANGARLEVRDSKLGDSSPVMDLSPVDWRGFLASVKR